MLVFALRVIHGVLAFSLQRHEEFLDDVHKKPELHKPSSGFVYSRVEELVLPRPIPTV